MLVQSVSEDYDYDYITDTDRHCLESDQASQFQILLIVWFSLGASATTALLLFTVLRAFQTQHRMNQRKVSHCEGSQGEDSEPEIEVDCSNYDVVPQEVEKRRKTSHLEDIAEADESEEDQGRKGSNYSVSNDSKTLSTSSLVSRSSAYSRSSSECHNVLQSDITKFQEGRPRIMSQSNLSRHSLTVPGKLNLRRTESQNMADYALKVRGEGRGRDQRKFLFYHFICSDDDKGGKYQRLLGSQQH